jgi:acyl-CoA oxidase
LEPSCCLSYVVLESSEPPPAFAQSDLRRLLDGHNLPTRDWLFHAMEESPLFRSRRVRTGGRVFVAPDFNEGKEGQQDATMQRIAYLTRCGVFRGWLSDDGAEAELYKITLLDCIGVYDHSLWPSRLVSTSSSDDYCYNYFQRYSQL